MKFKEKIKEKTIKCFDWIEEHQESAKLILGASITIGAMIGKNLIFKKGKDNKKEINNTYNIENYYVNFDDESRED